MSDLWQAEVERKIILSRHDGQIQGLAHQRMNSHAEALVTAGQYPDLRSALLSLTANDYDLAYAHAALEQIST